MPEQVKHTPGPWRVGKRAKMRIVAGDDDTVASTGGDPTMPAEANARLIAAAPDMYEALGALLELHGGIMNGCDCESCKIALRARAAIAKAEGR
jgi:hypothetical protein